MDRCSFDDMRAILKVASMECRRVAGRFVVPTVAAIVAGLAWALFLQSQMLSVR